MGIISENFEPSEFNKKRILVRFDFNVPFKDGKISDTTRIDRAIPTIKEILEAGASKVIMMSHLGRPKGEVKESLSLEPIASYLAEKLSEEVYLSDTSISSGIKTLSSLNHIKLILLENLRFHPEEEANDTEFAKALSEFGDYYINDAFGVSHRKHASVYAINQFFDKKHRAPGPLMGQEITALAKITKKPTKPFVGIIGGAKVSDKIKTIEKLLISVDSLLIGGAMAYPFLKAKGYSVGRSMCLKEDTMLAEKILKLDRGNKIHLPIDHIVANTPETQAKEVDIIGDMVAGFDIGPLTIANFSQVIKKAKTVFWNGPMGLFENPKFSNGTFGIAKALAECEGYCVVGGGDSVAAINKSGLASQIDYISTGGGATLEYIENDTLPGIQALKFGVV
jgi:phosphoglycerate kinase